MTGKNDVLTLAWSAPYLGFAVFRGPTQLIDSGVRKISPANANTSSSMEPQVRRMVARFSPSVIAVRDARNQNSRHLGSLAHTIGEKPAMGKIEVAVIQEESDG